MVEYLGLAISVIIGASTAIGTYAVLRSQFARLKTDFSEHVVNDNNRSEKETLHHANVHEDFVKKFNKSFTEIDGVKEKITILEQSTAKHLTKEIADETYVRQENLDLQLKLIAQNVKHTDSNVARMGKQLEDVLNILSKRGESE